jgi:dipeptidyl aminopeptidase/acylaminoacyl peptidase
MRSLRSLGIVLLCASAGCEPNKSPIPDKSAVNVVDLAAARKDFVTRLRVHGPAPQTYQDGEPPVGVRRVEYKSGDLSLKGWLSTVSEDETKRPAVVYLHGGWSFGEGDWVDAEPFVKAGFVLFVPMLRGENGNPGTYESFLGEVDDAVAAGRYVASLPSVNPSKVFVAGHSVGGVLTCLVSMVPSPYCAAAALDGYVDMESWASISTDKQVPYDRNLPEEIRIRNPMAFVESLRCPLRLYSGDDSRDVNARLAVLAKHAGKNCELVEVPGDHYEMVAPSVHQSALWFRQLAEE